MNSENGVDETSGGILESKKRHNYSVRPERLQVQHDRIFPRHGCQFDHIYPNFTLRREITRLASFIKFS
jgi:hypothetical protein